MAVAMERLVEETVGLEETMKNFVLKGSSSSGDICKSCLFKPEESASRAGGKIWLAKNIDLNRIDCKVCGVSKKEEEVRGVTKKVEAVRCKVCVAKEAAKGFYCKFCSEASALSASCKICVADCNFCVAKAAAFHRFLAAGGDSIETAEKKVDAWPLGKLTKSNLDKIIAEGGCILETAAEKGDKKVITVKLPDSYLYKTMSTRPHTPLVLLGEASLQRNQENLRAGAVAALSLIAREENLLAQYVHNGHATVKLELKE